MVELSNSTSITQFSSGEVSAIQDSVFNRVQSAYSLFSGLTFQRTNPGGVHSSLNFGLTETPGILGRADHIDFLNRTVSDVSRVFSANFTNIVNEFSGITNRSAQITQLSAALAGTAVHELGHNLGLRHHDAHGDITFNGTAVNTGGSEDGHWMATGSTGISELQREATRTFSVNSLAKLAYAEGTLAVNPTAIQEIGDAGDTIATASAIAFESIPVANRFGEVIIGQLGSNTDVDVFAVELLAGSVLTADVNLDYAIGFAFDPVDTFLTVLDAGGTIIAANDDTLYSTTTFGSGNQVSLDSILYNIDIPTSGTYYISLSSFNSASSGDYQLLLHTNLSAVPEPAMPAFLLSTVAFVFFRRRHTSVGTLVNT